MQFTALLVVVAAVMVASVKASRTFSHLMYLAVSLTFLFNLVQQCLRTAARALTQVPGLTMTASN